MLKQIEVVFNVHLLINEPNPGSNLQRHFLSDRKIASAGTQQNTQHNETGQWSVSLMASLQQIQVSPFAPVDCIAVAFLRRSCTVLTFHSTESYVGVHRQTEKGIWNKCGGWTLPKADRIIGFYALESFYYFGILAGSFSFVSS
jgi:hypothetical protein